MVVECRLGTRQASGIAPTEEEVDRLTAFRLRTEKEILEMRRESEPSRRQTSQNLAEITDKLNVPVGYLARRRPGEGFKH